MPMYLKMTIERVAGISACTGKGWFEALVNFGSCGQKPLHVGERVVEQNEMQKNRIPLSFKLK